MRHKYFRNWWSIREKYTNTEITVNADRLPAISGIARRIHALTRIKEEDYLAGLERGDLVNEPSWKVFHEELRQTPLEYCAPTWSWASTRGRMTRTYYYPREALVEIVEIKTFPLDDPYGEVSGGHLRLRGRLCIVMVIEAKDCGVCISDEPSLPVEMLEVAGHRIQHVNRGDHSTQVGVNIYWDGDSRDTLTRFNGLFFKFAFYRTCDSWFGREGHGFLLKETGQKRGQYQRVGLMEIRGAEFCDIFERAGKVSKLLENACQEFDGVDIYTIEIV